MVTDSTGASYVKESFTAFGNRREASTWSGPPTTGERTAMDSATREGYTFQTALGQPENAIIVTGRVYLKSWGCGGFAPLLPCGEAYSEG